MTVVRIALRQQRRGLVGFALLGFILMILQVTTFSEVAGTSTAERLQFARTAAALGQQFTWLYPAPVHLETLAGYLQWRDVSITVIVFALWSVFAGTAVLRRDEERGLLDVWLSTGVPRARLVLVRAAVLAGVFGAAVVATFAGALLGAAAAHEDLPVGGVLQTALAVWAVMLAFGGGALLLSQVLRSRRAATGAGCSLVVALELLNGFARQVDGLRPLRILSPFHWYDRAADMTGGGEAAVLLVPAVTALALIAATVAAFATRDTGAALLRLPARTRAAVLVPSANPLLRLPLLSALHRERWGLCWWSVGVAAGAAFVTAVAKPAADLLDSNPQLRTLLPSVTHGASTAALYIGFAWFGLAALVSVAFAVTAAARWIADDLEGRLAMVLSAPRSRADVVLERLADLWLQLAVLSAVDIAAVLLAAGAAGIDLDAGRVAVAAALLVPVGTAFGAAGAVLAGVVPRATVTVLSALALASYLLYTLGPLLKLPEWVLRLSPFHLYGTPLVDGVFVAGLVTLLAVTAAGSAAALGTVQRREIGG